MVWYKNEGDTENLWPLQELPVHQTHLNFSDHAQILWFQPVKWHFHAAGHHCIGTIGFLDSSATKECKCPGTPLMVHNRPIHVQHSICCCWRFWLWEHWLQVNSNQVLFSAASAKCDNDRKDVSKALVFILHQGWLASAHRPVRQLLLPDQSKIYFSLAFS